ncbi:MAG: AraC family transcriptional regulator [Clostridiales bacterium]|nr:AraC family transcriptional regulator [Clostridiales bacterium]
MKDKKIENVPEVDTQMEKRALTKSAHGSRRGAYSAAVSALVIAIVIVLNLILGGLQPGTLEFDISGKKMYTISEQSVDFLKTLNKDISIVVLAQDDAIDERLLKLMNNYAKLSSHITLKIVDPVLDPTALTKYNARENNVIVSCPDTNKTKILNLAGMEGYQEGLILYDAMYYQYYNQLQAVYLDAEGLLTSAINNVISEAQNKIYLLNGHNEAEPGANASSYLSKANYETAGLNLLTDGSIPEDCRLILCNNPAADLADDEFDMLASYLRNGGKLMLFLDYPNLSNFNTLLEIYGLQMQNGYVGDNDRYYKAYAQDYGIFCIYPVLSAASDITSSVTTDAFLRGARGMLQVTPQRTGAVVTPFMTSSADAVLMVDENNVTEGQYILGAVATETYAGKADTETRLTVITAVDLLSDDISTRVNLSNMDIFINAVNRNFGDVESYVIPAKNLELTPTLISHPLIWSVVFIGVIPLGILAGGFVYWIRRRNR